MLAISIPVHESPEVIENQVMNIRRFNPDAYVVLHLSFGAYHLRQVVTSMIKKFQGVYLNPTMYPTQWGWMLHTHIFNYKYLKSIGITFDYFLTESSHTMYVRSGVEKYIGQYEYLSNSKTLNDCTGLNKGLKWVADKALSEDPGFTSMMKEMQFSQVFLSQHEGTAYRSDLMEEMVRIFDKYYKFTVFELRYPREEVWLSTVSGNLSRKYGSPFIYMGRWVHPAYLSPPGIPAAVDEIRKHTGEGPVVSFSRRKFWEQFYGVKPVNRNINDPVRQYISSLH